MALFFRGERNFSEWTPLLDSIDTWTPRVLPNVLGRGVLEVESGSPEQAKSFLGVVSIKSSSTSEPLDGGCQKAGDRNSIARPSAQGGSCTTSCKGETETVKFVRPLCGHVQPGDAPGSLLETAWVPPGAPPGPLGGLRWGDNQNRISTYNRWHLN